MHYLDSLLFIMVFLLVSWLVTQIGITTGKRIIEDEYTLSAIFFEGKYAIALGKLAIFMSVSVRIFTTVLVLILFIATLVNALISILHQLT